MKKIPELLAPAGNLESAITAFENGADAVYAGLSKFNARERTENFKDEQFAKLMAYANKNGKKVYLTFNTLLKENEIKEALDTLCNVTRLLPDAIITQDLGVVKILREYFPHIPIHASTQMGIHNSAGVQVAKELGIERVILERQVTLDEIKSINDNSDLELEVFIHGALCCSLSGVCLFSSWMGGHSGNRGKCKQPCRRRYFSKEGNGFFFSTQDLYTLEDIPKLKKAGVVSLKIEGRLRKSDYVAATVKAYRMMLDAEDDEYDKILPEAKAVLSGSLGRKWSSGFYDKDKFDEVIESERMGVSGKQIGRVISLKKNGFDIETTQVLKLGDKIRVQPKSGMEGPAITVTKISKNGKAATRLGNRDRGFIHCDKEIPKDGLVYKTGVSAKEYGKLIDQLPVLKCNLDLVMTVNSKLITVRVCDHPNMKTWAMKVDIPQAQKHPVEASVFETEFKKALKPEIGIRNVNVEIDGNYFISQRDIRKIRQAFMIWLAENYTAVKEIKYEFPQLEVAQKPVVSTQALEVNDLPYSISIDRIARTTKVKKGEEYILPLFCPEKDLPELSEQIRKYYEVGVRHFRVTSIFQFELLKYYDDIEINTGIPLPVCNHLAIEELKDMGCNRIQLWVELGKEVLLNLASLMPDSIEIYRYGRPPILQTRAKLPIEGEITDARGAGFFVESGYPLSSLYSATVFALPDDELPKVSTFTDLTHARPGEHAVSTFNFDREMA